MHIGPLGLFNRTSDGRVLNVASWHSSHSITWRWSLSLIRQHLSIRPLFHAYRQHGRGGFVAGFGQLAAVRANQDNNGWQWSISLFWHELAFHQQQPMWYRDIVHRQDDEEIERGALPVVHVVPPPANHNTLH